MDGFIVVKERNFPGTSAVNLRHVRAVVEDDDGSVLLMTDGVRLLSDTVSEVLIKIRNA